MNKVVICMRASPERGPELYVVAGGAEYVIDGTISIELHKIQVGEVLTADIRAFISKLG